MAEPVIQDENKFTLDQDQLNAIRLESEGVSPSEKKRFDMMVLETHSRFREKMSPYLEKNFGEDIKDRFVLTDDETNEQFQRRWIDTEGKEVHFYGDGVGVYRTFIDQGDFVVGVPLNLWDKISEENRRSITAKYGSEEKAREMANYSYRVNCVMHEITHLYQDPSKLFAAPFWLLEAQGFWAARELVDPKNKVSMSRYDKMANFYQTLLDKYGDDVHRLCMTSNFNPTLLMKLTEEFTPQIQQEFFPDFKTGKPESQ